jgi:hypothetical protein
VSFVKGPVGGGLVADEKAEVFGNRLPGLAEGEAEALEAGGAEAEPLIEGHFFDQDLFGVGGGLVVAVEVGQERMEFFGIFVWQEVEA